MPLYSQYDVPTSDQMVNFGVGQPSTKDLPLEWFNSTLQNIGSTLKNPEFLQYGSISGYASVREKLANWLSNKYKNKNKISPDDLFMTNGNTGALQLLMDVYMESGDEIIIEDPSYFLAKNMFEEFGLNVNSVPMEDDGINIQILEETIKKIIAEDTENLQSMIFLYTIPIHHNPSSITLSKRKRLNLAKLCKKYPKFHIIADEVYHFLSFNEIDDYSLADYDSKIFALGSFSKILAPALRVGWIYQNNNMNPNNLLKKIKDSGILDSGGGINPLGYLLIESAISDGSLDKNISKNIKNLSDKSQLMYDFINSQQTDIELKNPQGGYFLWLKLNIKDANDFLNFALKFKVKFHPGYKFGKSCNNYIRLSVSYYDQDDIIIGLSRLIDAYKLYNKIRVSINGVNGKLGSLIKNEINNNNKFHFVNGISRDICIDVISNIILDVSSNTGTYNLVKYLLDKDINKPLLIGTTGLSKETMFLIRRYSIKNPIGIISNFSEGVNMVKKLINNLNDLGENWSFNMTEKHHIHKKDSPSGTAKTLMNEINRKCNINSIREGEIIGFHELNINNNEEEIIISHNAKTRNTFAKGCLNYLSWIVNKSSGIYYEIDSNKNKYYIKKILDMTFLITENEEFKNLILDGINFVIFLTNNNNIYEWNIEKERLSNLDINYHLLVVKYLYETYNKMKGVLQDNIEYQIVNDHIVFTIGYIPVLYDLKVEETDALASLINQLSGITTLGISKYILEGENLISYLVIDIKEEIDTLDPEVFMSLSTIINSDRIKRNAYIICFVNVLKSDEIRTKIINDRSNDNINSYISVFEYSSLLQELSYDNNIILNIINDDDIIKARYDSKLDTYLLMYNKN